MRVIDLKPTHKPAQSYYAALRQFDDLAPRRFGPRVAARSGRAARATHARRNIIAAAIEKVIDALRSLSASVGERAGVRCRSGSRLTHGFWEAKGIRDDLPREARKKFALGYPRDDNILFQTPRRALLFQSDSLAFDADLLRSPNSEVRMSNGCRTNRVLKQPSRKFDNRNSSFDIRNTPPAYSEWERAVSEFQERVPELAGENGGLAGKDSFISYCRENAAQELST
jgi:hypothetical protein